MFPVRPGPNGVHFIYLTLCMRSSVQVFSSSADFFFKNNIFKTYFKTTIIVSHSLDPDLPRRIVEPDLGPK